MADRRARPTAPPPSGAPSRCLIFPLALVAALAPGHAPAAEPADPPLAIVSGQPLAAALDELAARGLPVVFSSRLVPPELTVVSPPRGDDLRRALDELLAPYGLAAVPGAGDSLVVVAAEPRTVAPGAIAGVVRSRRGGAALAAVAVRASGADTETTTALDGSFRIDALPPGVHELELRRPGFVIESLRGIVIRAGATTEVTPLLTPAPFAGDEIDVHPSRAAVLRDEASSAVRLDRDDVLALPHLGNDVLRALEILPGVASNDVTAQFHVRGGRRDEVLVLLDGQELYEAFHLRDFDSALSLVAASNLTGVHLSTGAFGVDHGDRMGGVLDLTTAPPPAPGRYRLGASALAVELAAARPFAGGASGWLVSGRRGTSELAREILDKQQPEYWDLFGRLDGRFGDGQTARLHFLLAGDRYELLEPGDEESKRIATDYDVEYLWLTHQAVLGSRLFVDSAVSWSGSSRDRRDREIDPEKQVTVLDRRDSEVVSLQQTWNAQLGERHQLRAGLVARRFSTAFDYFAARAFTTPLVTLRAEPRDGETRLDQLFVDRHLAAFVADRWQLGEPLTVEAGLRHDRHSLVSRSETSPRLHLVWAARPGQLVRIGWGRYAQSQRPYELAVEDGESAFSPPERSTHWVVGWERQLAPRGRRGATALRLELYRRDVARPRPRVENLLEPFDAFPEAELDRYLFAPERARAEGVELFVRARLGERFDGWLDYAWARSEDRLGGRWVPRLVDQRHTLNWSLHAELPRRISLALAGLFHTGRPTTSLGLVDIADGNGDGESDPVPVLGPINGERLGNYFRLDLRLAREIPARQGRLAVYLDVQNLLGRQNDAGFSFEYDEDARALDVTRERWPGVIPSVGFVWEF